ncbi:amino acid racemase [Mitsuaria sp. GD03876]|uniref:aspartate/glutamate racemase family protein n=1 Tax=Mitsuaria sp. GD03876 TaxID=2975399 RepID=UPI002446FE52|nr:amino acid racemase [Mitsuaria sp. GD03876]MDH0867568.1 amino acid racemase [Mitsuaria sp. GD03876]
MPGAPGVVGILGGMGPLATVDFMRKMLEATPAAADQDHVPVVVSSIPQVPDRTAAFRGDGDSPLAAMVGSGRRLVAAGAGLLVMPCNTAHLWFDELQEALGLPMLHLVDAAIDEVLARVPEGAPVGLLSTDATLASGLYLNRRAADGRGVRWLLPTAVEMLEQVMPGIAAVKAGQVALATPLLAKAAQALRQRGARALVLGCTEIPLALDAASAGLPVIDATAALARRAVAWALDHRAPHGGAPSGRFTAPAVPTTTAAPPSPAVSTP